MKNRKLKILTAIAILLSLSLSLLFASCSGSGEKPNTDRQGNPINLPDGAIERVISLGPAYTEILVGLGLTDKIIAIDTYATGISGLPADIPLFDMQSPDAEQIVNLNPDVIFATAMAQISGDDPYKPIKDAGICVIYIPSSESIDAIKEDIKYIASVMGVKSKGDDIIKDMEKKIADIKKIGDTIGDSEKRSVYFEIGFWSPALYSVGSGMFINEMIEIIGAKNSFADQSGWLNVSDEAVLEKNPDVILTTVDYIDDPVGEIKSRPGWEALAAVQNDDVYYITTNASNRPNQNITKALEEIAKAVYPDKYK